MSKEYSVVFLVESEKFNLGKKKLGNKVQAGEKFKFALSVLLRTRLAHRLSSQLFAAVSTPNIAELVLFGFFLSTTMVFTAVQTHFARKNTSIFMLIGSLSR